MPPQNEGLCRLDTNGRTPPAGQMLNAQARSRMGPLAQLGGIGVYRREFVIQGFRNIHKPVRREKRRSTGRLPFSTGRHFKAEQSLDWIPAQGTTGSDHRFVYSTVVDVQVTGMVGKNHFRAALRDERFDNIDDVKQCNSVHTVIRKITERD